MPVVSVVMPVYNGEKYVAKAIDSVLSQSLSDLELLIVDDGSTDFSADIIRLYAKRDDRIRVFPLEQNVGRGDARNLGFSAAQGAYIAGMDCDEVSLPHRLERQLEFLEAHPEIGAVGTAYHVIFADQPRTSYDAFLPARHAVIELYRYFRLTLCGASVMYRRELLQAAGGNPPNTREADDLALQLKLLWEAGITFANLREVHYIYRVDEDSHSEKDAKLGFPREKALRQMMLERLLGKYPEYILESLNKLRSGKNFTKRERRAAKRALCHIAEALIERGLVDASDRSLMSHAIDRALEGFTPRRWQQFCHWRRRRLPSLYPDLLKSIP